MYKWDGGTGGPQCLFSTRQMDIFMVSDTLSFKLNDNVSMLTWWHLRGSVYPAHHHSHPVSMLTFHGLLIIITKNKERLFFFTWWWVIINIQDRCCCKLVRTQMQIRKQANWKQKWVLVKLKVRIQKYKIQNILRSGNKTEIKECETKQTWGTWEAAQVDTNRTYDRWEVRRKHNYNTKELLSIKVEKTDKRQEVESEIWHIKQEIPKVCRSRLEW